MACDLINVVRIKFGSHLYGTSTPSSDVDWKSVHLPAARDVLLQRAAPVVALSRPDKAPGARNKPGDVDDESYALHRWLQLLAEGQTVALDMLFAPDGALAGPVHWTWREVRANAGRLVSKKSAAFVGYCRTQANKYGIKGSRVAAARRAAEFFALTLEEGYKDARVGDLGVEALRAVCDDEHTKIVVVPRHTGADAAEVQSETFFECCNRKVSFGSTVKAACELYKRIYDEYGDRARLAETGQGVDWKALSHAVRVGREALELLSTGRITFPLPCAARVLAVKTGTVPYAEVAAEIEGLLAEVEEASVVSALPDEPDRAWMDDLVATAYAEVVRRS